MNITKPRKEFLKTRLSECSRIIVEWRKIVAPNQHLFLKSVAYKQHSIIFASDNFVVAAMKVKSRMISVYTKKIARKMKKVWKFQ